MNKRKIEQLFIGVILNRCKSNHMPLKYLVDYRANNPMEASEHDFFNLLNDIVLLKFDTLAPWEKNVITDLHNRAITRQPISNKQKEIAKKTSKKK